MNKDYNKIKDTLDKINNITIKKYFNEFDKLYNKDTKELIENIKDSKFETLQELLLYLNTYANRKKWDKETKENYIHVVRGVVVEEQIANENPQWERSNDELDHLANIDFIDRENKILWSVKCAFSINTWLFEKTLKYFEDKQEWDEYEIKVLWIFPTLDKREIIEIRKEKDMKEKNIKEIYLKKISDLWKEYFHYHAQKKWDDKMIVHKCIESLLSEYKTLTGEELYEN